MTYIAGNINADMLKSENLSGVGDYATCRSNLGLALNTIKDARIKEIGRGTLVLGSVTINTSVVTDTSNIWVDSQAVLVNAGALSISTRTAGVSFTVVSSNAADGRTFAYIIIEP